jgi:hypothetical protein
MPALREWPRKNPYDSAMGSRVIHRMSHIANMIKHDENINSSFSLAKEHDTVWDRGVGFDMSSPHTGFVELMGKRPDSKIIIRVPRSRLAKPIAYFTDAESKAAAQKIAKKMKLNEGWLLGMRVLNYESFLNSTPYNRPWHSMNQAHKDIVLK